MQLEHLRTYEVVRSREDNGELTLAAWFYDVERADIEEYRPEYGRYVPLGSDLRRERAEQLAAPKTPTVISEDPAA